MRPLNPTESLIARTIAEQRFEDARANGKIWTVTDRYGTELYDVPRESTAKSLAKDLGGKYYKSATA
jgi:hypothetical protein